MFKNIFDSHHVIERQTIVMTASVLLLGSSFIVSTMRKNDLEYAQLMKVDQSGTSSSFSKTDSTKITLGKTYLSSDKKTAYIPITFNTLDKTGINANDYKVYVGDATGKKMDAKFDGRLMLYPSKLRGVVVLNSSEKIQNQPLVMFILNMKNVKTLADLESSVDNDGVNASNSNDTFGNYDVAPFKINPGATDVTKRSKINIDSTSLKDVYASIFKTNDESKVESHIKKDQDEIQKNIEVAKELEQRLKLAGYEVPDEPAWMKESWRPYDTIDLKTGKTAKGDDALTYVPASSNLDSDDVEFPSTLNNQDGTNTNDASMQSSESSDSERSDNDETSTPSSQWSDLIRAWRNVKELKRDIYVNQYKLLYKYRTDERSVLKQASISSSKNFKQIATKK